MSNLLNIHSKYSCAPSVFHSKKNIYNDGDELLARSRFASCYRLEDLLAMVRSFNRGHNPKIKIPSNPTVDELWQALDKRLRRVCNDEVCWTRQQFAKVIPANNREWVEHFTFKPEMPIDSRTKNTRDAWLSNFDIEHVMRQYEKVYTNFVFLGPYPIDFANYYAYYGFNANKIIELIKKGVYRIGIIFNTGTLRSGGSHWVALFIDFHPPNQPNTDFGCNIEYFDSVGDRPPPIIQNLITKIKEVCEQSKKYCIKVHENVRQLRHQRGNNECGVYCLWFISERLKGRSYEEIQANGVPDDLMNQFRVKFFRQR